MTMNGRNVTLAEIKYFYPARHKNFNEDRSMLSAAKCRPMILVARSIKYMRIFAGASSTTSTNYEHGFCGRRTWRIYTRHMWLLATQLLATFKINIRSFDQCAECDLLKFVQNQFRAK